MEWKSQAGLLYTDDVCLIASSEEDMEKVNACVVEYDLKVNEKKSRVVCINGEVGRRCCCLPRPCPSSTQIAFLRWSNVGSTLYTTMAHGRHTTLDQCSFDRWRMVG